MHCMLFGQREKGVDCKNARTWHKFSVSSDHAAMIRAMYPEDVFISQQRQVKVKVEVHAEGYKADILALLDSGATDNFIAPAIVNAFQISTYDLPTSKVIHNVDSM